MAGNHFTAHSYCFIVAVFSLKECNSPVLRCKNSDNYRGGKIFTKLFAKYFEEKQKGSIFASLF